ncbi:MAG: type II secretion system F family protein [Deltaproteobacteria bacterium]|nr:type II secretion system F family protein [Deltaproteobacteria bacterium]
MIGLVLLLGFGATFVLILVIFSVVKRALEEYEGRYTTKGTQSLENMFFFVTTRQLLVLTVSVSAVFFIIGLVALNVVVGLILGAFGFAFPLLGIRYLKKRRIAKFERQLVDALSQMSAAFKAGLTLPQAADNIAREMQPPLGQEFGLLVKEIKLGIPMEEALSNMAARVNSEDLDLAVTSTNIARQLGGNMAEMYDIISATIRERFRLEGRIKALTAQGKMQGWVVASMPLVVGAAFYYFRPDLMKPMLHSNFGIALVGTVFIMEVLGMLMIRKIVNIDV